MNCEAITKKTAQNKVVGFKLFQAPMRLSIYALCLSLLVEPIFANAY